MPEYRKSPFFFTLKISEAKQRKVSVQKAVEKATVGREDTVRISSVKM